jgi:hypothetical protein
VSGGDHRWFKGSTGKKRPVTAENIIIIVVIIIIIIIIIIINSLSRFWFRLHNARLSFLLAY